jgi:hypothetical protein
MKSIFLLMRSAPISLLLLTLFCLKNANDPDDNRPGDTNIIGSSGGTVSLDTTASIIIPPGAVSKNAVVTITPISDATLFADQSVKRVIISCSTTVPFSAPVTIRVSAPSGFNLADSNSFGAGYIDTAGFLVAKPFSVHDSAGRLFISVATTHFSIWDFEFFSTPPEEMMLQVPYYNQGSTNYCWACALNMICEAARHIDPEETFSIVGATGIGNDGVYASTLRFNSTLATIVRARTSTDPERRILHTLELGNYRIIGALKREIGRGHPVELFPTSINHAVTIVGYDPDSFYVHNPNEVSAQVASRGMTYDQLVQDMGIADEFVLISIPRDLDPERPLVSVTIPHGFLRSSLHFVRVMQRGGIPSTFQWTSSRPDGYAFMTGSDLSDTIVDADSFYVRNIEVANAQTTAATMTMVYDILEASSGRSLYSDRQDITVAALGLSQVNFPGRSTGVFRDTSVRAGHYRFSVRALGNNTVHDAATIDLHMVWRPAFSISSLTPSSGAPGVEVVVQGKGFDTIRGQSTILFGTTQAEVLSWSDSSVRVKVPSTVTADCNVTAVVQGKTSNALPFKLNTTFILKRISPDYGSARSFVYLEGKGFGKTRGTSMVIFTGDTVELYRSWNDSMLEVEVPLNAKTGPVVVVVDSKTSNSVKFSLKPVLGYISPTSYPVPATVALHGTNFGDGKDSSFVLINNARAAVKSWCDTLIEVVIDTAYATSTASIVVKVGTLASSAKEFRGSGVRTISAIVPDSGMIGAEITLGGSNLNVDTAIGKVFFQPGVAAVVKAYTNERITVTVPEGAKDGPVLYVLPSGDTLRSPSFDVLDTLNILQQCNAISIAVYGAFRFIDTARHIDTVMSTGFGMQNYSAGHDLVYAPLGWSGQQMSGSGYDTLNDPYSGIDTFRINVKGSVSNDYHTVNIEATFNEIWPGNPPQIRKEYKVTLENVPLKEVTSAPSLTFKPDSGAVGAAVVKVTYYYVGLDGIPHDARSATWDKPGASLMVYFSRGKERSAP